jgi:hypothetical protein
LAKELQLLDPARFDNIFLGLGGFHTEKVMIACCGKYLEDTVIDSILVENEVYGPENVKSVMNGGNYVRGIRGMGIVSELLYNLLLDQFLIGTDDKTKNQIIRQVIGISQRLGETKNKPANIEWEKLTTSISSMGFDDFNKNGKRKVNNSFSGTISSLRFFLF